MRHRYLLFFCTLAYTFAFAQEREPYGKEFAQGNSFFIKKNYAGALKSFMQVYNTDSANANINYKIGLCYLGIPGEKNMAVTYLEKAVKKVTAHYNPASDKETAAPRQAYYYLGMAYHEASRFGEAISSFKNYRQYITAGAKDSLAEIDHRIEQCNNARMYVMVPGNATVIDLGDSINSAYSDYNAVIPADESLMLFTSNRPAGNNAVPEADGNYPSYIYISHYKPDSTWTAARLFDKTFNSMAENVSSFISSDGQQIFIYGSDGKTNTVLTSYPGDSGWTVPQDPGGDINSPPNATDVCLSPDGNTLYFVSERPGGFGGKDIWRCVKLPNGKWSLALNLGSTINTPYNEASPFMHSDGRTFFFSSEGHSGMGGYDVFFTQLLEDGKWVAPFNLGYPINTPDNEVHFSLSMDGKRAYLTSDRPGGKGQQDIYEVIMPKSGDKPLTVIRGQIVVENGAPLPDGVHIVATDNVTGLNAGDFKPVKATGDYTVIVPPGKSYTLSYQNGDKEFYSQIIEVPAEAGYKEIHKELIMPPVNFKTNAGKNNGSSQK